MGFKSLNQYHDDKNGEFFVLPNDKDSAQVIFLYRSVDDVMVADVHYLSTSTYSGYVHCLDRNCPACGYRSPRCTSGIKRQAKIFIPLYNLTKNKIEFWDRSQFFEQVLQDKVFGPYPNPSEVIFEITRQGAMNSRDTKYDIRAVYKNTSMPYDKILSDFGITLPDAYSKVCREMTHDEMAAALAADSVAASDLQDYGYTPVPRGSATAPVDSVPIENSYTVPAPNFGDPLPEVPPAFEGLVENLDPEPQLDPITGEIDESDSDLNKVKF